MTVNRGLFVRNNGTVGTTPIQGRLVLASLVAENAPGTPRNGLLDPKTATVVSGKADMSYDVAPINAVVNRAAGEGVYMFTTTGTTNVATTAAPGTGSRYDLIYVLQRDLDKGDSDNTAVLAVYQGTAATSPTKPYASLPAGALVLAEALVASGATATNGAGVTITQVWRYTALRGAPIPVRNTTERDEITAVAGLTIQRLDQGPQFVYTYNGSMWTSPALGRMRLDRVASITGAVSGLTVMSSVASVTFRGGRKYRIVWNSDWLSSGSNQAAAFYIATAPTSDPAAQTSGVTNLVVRDAHSVLGGTSAPLYVEAYFEPASDTTVQLKFLAQSDGGGGTVQVQGNRAGGSIYTVYDEGVQY